MINVLKDHIIVVFDDADKVSRCGELQEAAFSAGFEWASGCRRVMYEDSLKTLVFNSAGKLLLCKHSHVYTRRGQEVSIDFMINRLKEVASNGI